MAGKNPLYPGYYPGDPWQRRPSGGSIIEPQEYDLDVIAQQIDELEMTLTGVPEIIKENIIKDIKFPLRAALYAQKADPEQLALYDEEEIEELPGATGVTINLDPTKWLDDPKEQFVKTLKGVGESLFDFNELDARTRGELWRQLTQGADVSAKGVAAQAAVGGIATASMAKGRGKDVLRGVTSTSPLKVADSGIVDDNGKDLGSAFGNAIVTFQQNAPIIPFRDKYHDTILKTGIEAVAADIKAQTGDISTLPAHVTNFLARADFAKNFGNTADLIEKLDTSIKRALVEKPTGGGIAQIDTTHIEEAFTNLKAHLYGGKDTEGNVIEAADALLGDGGQLAQIGSHLTAEQYRVLIKPYEGMLKQLSALQPPTNLVGAKELERRLNSIAQYGFGNIGLTGGDAFRASVERQYLRVLEREIINDPGSILADFGGDLAKKIRVYLPKQAEDRAWHMATELAEAIEGGSIIRNYLWRRVLNRIEGCTPAYHVASFMKRMHYFGLIVNEKEIDYSFRNPLFTMAQGIVKQSKWLKNNFSIDIAIPGTHGISVNLEGGNHFKAVAGLTILVQNGDLDKNDLKTILIEAGKISGFATLDKAEKVKKMREALLAMGKPAAAVDAIPDEVLEKASLLTVWLAKNKDKLAKAGLNIENADSLKRFLVALNSFGIDPARVIEITRKYAGLLEKATQYLNNFQKKILKSTVGKLAAKALNIKNAIAEWASNAIMAIFGTATEGLGFLATPLKVAIKWVIKKVLDVAEGVGKIFLKADITQLDIVLEKSMVAVGKILSVLIAIPTLFGMLAMFCAMVLLGAISPINPAKGAGGDLQHVDTSTGGIEEMDPIQPGGCPLPGGYLTYPSYGRATRTSGGYITNGSGFSRVGHGTENYWGSGGCRYRMPSGHVYSLPPDGPIESGSRCYASARIRSEDYGKAADFDNSPYPPDTGMGVFVPELPGMSADNLWRISGLTTGEAGQGIILRGSGDHDYVMWILHIDRISGLANGMNIAPGRHIGNIWDGWPGGGNEHIHVELIVDGVPVRPETWLCH